MINLGKEKAPIGRPRDVAAGRVGTHLASRRSTSTTWFGVPGGLCGPGLPSLAHRLHAVEPAAAEAPQTFARNV